MQLGMDMLTQNLEAAAARKGVTLRDVARRIGVDQSTITKWQNGASPSGRLYNKMMAAIEALPTPPEVAADRVADGGGVDHAATLADRGAGVSESCPENSASVNDNAPAVVPAREGAAA